MSFQALKFFHSFDKTYTKYLYLKQSNSFNIYQVDQHITTNFITSFLVIMVKLRYQTQELIFRPY
jgi:hypothetical protein